LSQQNRTDAIGRPAHLGVLLVPEGTRLPKKVAACLPNLVVGPSARARRNSTRAWLRWPVHASRSPRWNRTDWLRGNARTSGPSREKDADRLSMSNRPTAAAT